MTPIVYKLAVDMDGFLLDDNYPHLGEPYPEIVAELQRRHALGETILIHTCRLGVDPVIYGKEYRNMDCKIRTWLAKHQIPYDGLIGKPLADNYLDDRNLSREDFLAGKSHPPIIIKEP